MFGWLCVLDCGGLVYVFRLWLTEFVSACTRFWVLGVLLFYRVTWYLRFAGGFGLWVAECFWAAYTIVGMWVLPAGFVCVGGLI